MKNSLLKSFFSTGLQALAVQVLGVLFFFIISIYLPKDSFGIIVSANAVSAMITAFLSFGMEQVIVRRIAASSRSDWAAAAFFFHALVGSAVSFCILLFLSNIFSHHQGIYYLPWYFLAQALMYMATPLKQYLNAKQQFAPYGVIAVVSNVLKVGMGYILLRKGLLTISTASIVLILAATIEFIALWIYVKSKTGFSLSFRRLAYYKLIKESFPLYITAIFDALLKRADAILLGILATGAITGDYGFAYKAFEMATLPIVMVGPIILAKLARTSLADGYDETKKHEIKSLFTIEIFLAMLIPLVLNLLWSPLLDHFTKGKYGTVNGDVIFVLSLCVPLLFIINLLWTLCFTTRKYKKISIITLVSAVSNLILNAALIPWLGGVGAAIAFLVTTLIQATFYCYIVSREIFVLPFGSFLLIFLLGAVAYYVGITITSVLWLRLIIVIALYITLSVAFKQIGKAHLYTLKSYLKR
ncbi:MAG: hypothetical protein EOP56_03910 [Sphingobacteriales bacterium]|nr:MAG: hypothetical protein EOP56_03910 [Sphingobacteriales bacterium]